MPRGGGRQAGSDDFNRKRRRPKRTEVSVGGIFMLMKEFQAFMKEDAGIGVIEVVLILVGILTP